MSVLVLRVWPAGREPRSSCVADEFLPPRVLGSQLPGSLSSWSSEPSPEHGAVSFPSPFVSDGRGGKDCRWNTSSEKCQGPPGIDRGEVGVRSDAEGSPGSPAPQQQESWRPVSLPEQGHPPHPPLLPAPQSVLHTCSGLGLSPSHYPDPL